MSLRKAYDKQDRKRLEKILGKLDCLIVEEMDTDWKPGRRVDPTPLNEDRLPQLHRVHLVFFPKRGRHSYMGNRLGTYPHGTLDKAEVKGVILQSIAAGFVPLLYFPDESYLDPNNIIVVNESKS